MPVASRPIRSVRFGAFAAGLRSGELFRDGVRIKLQEQPFKILAMLLERPGEVVTREELRQTLWPGDTLVDVDHGINVAMNKIRVALGESSEVPQFIETVGTRGYRFIQAVEPTSDELRRVPSAAAGLRRSKATRHTVGREKEAAQLRSSFESAISGRGLLICVTGEAGIGKTTLVEDFLADVTARGQPHLVGRGRCSERLAGTEAYLPILEAFESLLHGDGSKALARVMRRVAPSWHAQVIPQSGRKSEPETSTETGAMSQERLKREVVAFLKEISSPQPLILFIDDMHWADISTVDLLAYIGANLERLPVLIIATYRPSELFPAKHPFSRIQLDLQTRGVCMETPVEFLSKENIDSYLALEFPQHRFPRSFSPVIHAKTEGNALFMVDMLRYLTAQQVIAEQDGGWSVVKAVPAIEREMPESVRSMIVRKIDQLNEEDRSLLTTAAVQGFEFESAVLACVLRRDAGEVEDRLEALDRLYGFVRSTAEHDLPDRTRTLRFRFVHVLYQNAFYGSLGPTRRAALSGEVAKALLSFHGEHVAPIAPMLAFLFESARDPWRASEFYLLAVQNAARVFAHDEAITLARHGLALIGPLPKTAEHAERELSLQVALTMALTFSRGYAVAETTQEMARTLAICEGLGDSPHLFPVWFALAASYLTTADFQKAREMGERLLAIGEASQDPILFVGAHAILGIAFHQSGDLLTSHFHAERAIALHDPKQIASYAAIYRTDPGPIARGVSIRTLYLLGYPDQAARRIQETLALAGQGSDRSRIAFPLVFAAFFYQFLGQAEKVRQVADECLALCREYGNPQEQGWVTCIRGWAVAESGHVEEGIAEIRAGLAFQRSVGAVVAWTHFLSLLADAARKARRTQEALAAISEGMECVRKYQEHFYEAELYRLKGELSIQDVGNAQEAEACFGRAINIARGQGAKALELRAAISLSHLWLKNGRGHEVRGLLSPIYGWFTEGFDTPDLKAAGALLGQAR